MTVFESIKSKNIDELSEWLDKYGAMDCSPWTKWFDENYCSKCEAEEIYVSAIDAKHECAWCELHGKCKYFQEMNDIPDNKQVIKMWLETEDEYEENGLYFE